MKTLFQLLSGKSKTQALKRDLSQPEAFEAVEQDQVLLFRGGYKEYTPPLYENQSQNNWSQPDILLNS